MMKSAVLLTLFCILLGQGRRSQSAAVHPSPPTQGNFYTTEGGICGSSFYQVGDRCVLVEPFTHSTWNEARYLCERFNGGLVILDSMDFYAELIEHLHYEGLDIYDYWVGASDSDSEGWWKWSNGQTVRLGSPLWAIYTTSNLTGDGDYEQEPQYSGSDCGYLDSERYFFMDDDDCASLKPCICQAPLLTSAAATPAADVEESAAHTPGIVVQPVRNVKNDAVKPVVPYISNMAMDIPALTKLDIPNPAYGLLNDIPERVPANGLVNDSPESVPKPALSTCRTGFDRVGDKCVFVDPFTSSNWDEAQYLCERFGGNLVSMQSMDFYAALIDYIEDKGLDTHDYWVGASDSYYEGNWRWMDGSSVQMGTPLWALYYHYHTSNDGHYLQEPQSDYNEDCAYMELNRFYYLDDTECSTPMPCICEAPIGM